MDKRWIAIIIIMILAVICGYFVVSYSDTVGNAIVDVNKSTTALPPGFSVGDSDKDSVILYMKDNVKKIYIKDLGKGDLGLNKKNQMIKSLSKDGDIEIIDNVTNSTGENKLYTIYYQNYSNTKLMNQSYSYLYSQNHTYLIKCDG